MHRIDGVSAVGRERSRGLDRIIISDLRLQAVIGVSEPERQAAQELVLQLVLLTDLRPAGRSDDLADTIDYSAVVADIGAIAAASRHHLIERLATAIAERCIREHGADGVVVHLAKPGALPSAGSVAVRIRRGRAELPDAG
jgi:FolB domain-containing protein